MRRGQFVRGDGLILPNNISLIGGQMLLAAACRNTVPTFYAALVSGFPLAAMSSAIVSEPTIGVRGYARVPIERSAVGWPSLSNLGNEAYIETDWLEFISTADPGFDHPINRVCLLGTSVYGAGDPIYAMSSPLDADLTIIPATPLDQRRFKYQLFI